MGDERYFQEKDAIYKEDMLESFIKWKLSMWVVAGRQTK